MTRSFASKTRWLWQICGQVFRYAIASGRAEHVLPRFDRASETRGQGTGVLGLRGTPDCLRGKALTPPAVMLMQCPDRGIRKPRRVGFAKLQ